MFFFFRCHLLSSKIAHFIRRTQTCLELCSQKSKKNNVLPSTVTVSQKVENQRKPIKSRSASGVSPITLPQTHSCALLLLLCLPSSFQFIYIVVRVGKTPEFLPSWWKSLPNCFYTRLRTCAPALSTKEAVWSLLSEAVCVSHSSSPSSSALFLFLILFHQLLYFLVSPTLFSGLHHLCIPFSFFRCLHTNVCLNLNPTHLLWLVEISLYPSDYPRVK